MWGALPAGSTAETSLEDLYLVGKYGRIFHSQDGGKTWTPEAKGSHVFLSGVWGISPREVYAVGAGGTILCTTDGGGTWLTRKSGTKQDLHDVWGSPEDIYAVGEEGTLLHSTDRGETWIQAQSVVQGDLYGVWGDGAGGVYVVGSTFRQIAPEHYSDFG